MVPVVALSSLEGIIADAQSGEALQNGYHAQLVIEALASDWVTLALSILCALPYTSAFVEDIKSGFCQAVPALLGDQAIWPLSAFLRVSDDRKTILPAQTV